MLPFCLLIIAVFSDWNYKQNGADWPECIAQTKYQSPIDINTKRAKLLSTFYFFPRLDTTIHTFTCDNQN